MARFIEMNRTQSLRVKVQKPNLKDKEIIEKIQNLVEQVTKDLENYNFNFAAEKLYEFIWHEFADKYIEDVKKRLDKDSFETLNSSFTIILKLLHPFMPFITEEIYKKIGKKGSIMIQEWPK